MRVSSLAVASDPPRAPSVLGLSLVAAAACLAAASGASGQAIHIPLSERVAPPIAGAGGASQLYALHVTGPITRMQDAEAHLAWPPAGAARYCSTVGAAVDFAGSRGGSGGARCLPFSAPAACRATPVRGDGRHVAMRIAGLLDVDAAAATRGLTFALRHDDGVLLTVGATRSSIVLLARAGAADVERRYVTFDGPGLYPYTLDYYQNEGPATLGWTWHAGDVPYDAASFAPIGARLVPDGSLACGPSCTRCGGATPYCLAAAGEGACVGCLYDFQCADGARCAAATHACEPRACASDAECGGGAFCAGAACQPCTTREHCGGHDAACQACTGATPLCGSARACIGCRSSADCAASQACSVQGLCVGGGAAPGNACSEDTGCGDAGRAGAAVVHARRGRSGCGVACGPRRGGPWALVLAAVAARRRRARSRRAR